MRIKHGRASAALLAVALGVRGEAAEEVAVPGPITVQGVPAVPRALGRALGPIRTRGRRRSRGGSPAVARS